MDSLKSAYFLVYGTLKLSYRPTWILAMDQGNRGLPSLTHTMYLDKALCRHLSPPPIGVPPALVAGITGK